MKKQKINIIKIKKDLQSMFEEDQKMRQQYANNLSNWNHSLDIQNTKKLKGIVSKIGWPIISLVGKESSFSAWIIIQHADHDQNFQKYCLKLMKAELKNEVVPANIALLTDRIAVNSGNLQIYGSQFYQNSDGKMVPRPILDPVNLDRRRKKMGLESFTKYANALQCSYLRD